MTETQHADLRTGGESGYLRIATEEAFAPPEMIAAWRAMVADGSVDDIGFQTMWGFYLNSPSDRARAIVSGLQDLGEQRLADMDATGIDRQIISLTAPGTQIFDTDRARGFATLANDQLADACRKHPDRFSGLTAVAPQDPAHAAAEIERGKHELGFHGVIINSHTADEYLDQQKFWPVLEAAEALDTPVYLHPTTPSSGLIRPLLEAGLDGAIYGFAVETGMHLLRMITSGVFDRFPNLRVVVGHLGEALPYWMYRLDHMHAATVKSERYESVKPLKLKPSEYLRRNIWVTTSGMAWEPAILFNREVLGADRVLYAMDYPYEYVADEVRVHDRLPLTVEERKALFQTNAERVFGLATAESSQAAAVGHAS
jgi:5-carboxyvanillate decarboxylase